MGSRRHLAFFLGLFFICQGVIAEKNKPVPAKAPAQRKSTKFNEALVQTEDPQGRFHRLKLNLALGMHISRGTGVAATGQIGFAPISGVPLYIGPEASFTLFSPGHVLMTMGSIWYDWKIYGAPRLSLGVGASLGVAFTARINNLSSTVNAGYFDACIVQEIDDLVSIRGQFRPGVLGQYFSFLMNFSVSFRFF